MKDAETEVLVPGKNNISIIESIELNETPFPMNEIKNRFGALIILQLIRISIVLELEPSPPYMCMWVQLYL